MIEFFQMWGKTEYILDHAGDLDRLARNLEKEAAKWFLPDHSKSNWDRERVYNSTQRKYHKRADVLWFNAVEAGIKIFKLCGLGAFDDQPRIKNMVHQVRSIVEINLEKFTVPARDKFGLYSIYTHRTENSLDVIFVKIFESLCKMYRSPEDRMTVKYSYDNLRPLAQLHAKVMYKLGSDLKSRFDKPEPKEDFR